MKTCFVASNRVCLSVVTMLLSAFLCSCSYNKTETATSGFMTVMCDNSFENILQQEVDVFEFIYENSMVVPYYIPQEDAIDSLLNGKTKTIVIARELDKTEKNILVNKNRKITSKKIAVDAIALIVNPDNEIEEISVSQIGDILAGEITDWNEIAPSDLGGIRIAFDDNSSSMIKYMRDSLLCGREFGKTVYVQGSIDGVFDAVARNKDVIGIIGVSWVTADMRGRELTPEQLSALGDDISVQAAAEFASDIKVLAVRGRNSIEAKKPYQAYIYSGEYPLFRQIYMITTAAPGAVDHRFLSFVTSVKGQNLILKTGILPATKYIQVVELTN